MMGKIHLYCGDGKGKTTAAVGLAVRAAGAGKLVLFTQFFKDGSSSEIPILAGIGNIQVIHRNTVRGFYSRMTEEERAVAARDYTEHFREICKMAQNADVLGLDEKVSACNHAVVPEDEVIRFLEGRPGNLEVILTGRNPSHRLLELADYVTRMEKVKHPFDRGLSARKGIEF